MPRMRLLFFIVLAAVGWGARVIGQGVVGDAAGSAVLALGLVIIGGVLAGEFAVKLNMPRISGYLVLGMIVGPFALGLETFEDAKFLRLFEELALGLIALTAGGEFRLQGMRRRIRPLTAIVAAHTVGILVIVAAGMFFVLGHLPGFSGLEGGQILAAAALLGVIAVAVSPSTTVAVITELRARGELVETVLGVTILKDLMILLLFTWVNMLAHSWISGSPVDVHDLHGVGLEILISLGVGVVLGLLFGAYISKVGRYLSLLVVLLALVSAELSAEAGLEHLLVCMAAGFVVRNFFPHQAGDFLDALEMSSTPIYIVFFALIGAGLDVGILVMLWVPALFYVALRLGSVWVLTVGPALMAGSGPFVVRYGWMGFVAQAGLSLGLAARIQRELPGFGSKVATLIVAAVVINQLIGPVLWAWAIRKAGEAE